MLSPVASEYLRFGSPGGPASLAPVPITAESRVPRRSSRQAPAPCPRPHPPVHLPPHPPAPLGARQAEDALPARVGGGSSGSSWLGAQGPRGGDPHPAGVLPPAGPGPHVSRQRPLAEDGRCPQAQPFLPGGICPHPREGAQQCWQVPPLHQAPGSQALTLDPSRPLQALGVPIHAGRRSQSPAVTPARTSGPPGDGHGGLSTPRSGVSHSRGTRAPLRGPASITSRRREKQVSEPWAPGALGSLRHIWEGEEETGLASAPSRAPHTSPHPPHPTRCSGLRGTPRLPVTGGHGAHTPLLLSHLRGPERHPTPSDPRFPQALWASSASG